LGEFVGEECGACDDGHCDSADLEVRGQRQLRSLGHVRVGFCAVIKVDEENQNVDRMHEFTASVLKRVVEGLAIANVGQKRPRNKSEDDAARSPIVDHCQQKPERKPVNDRRNHIPRLQPLPLKFINVLPKLLLACY